MNRIKHKISRRALLAISGLLAASLVTAGNTETSRAGTSRSENLEIQIGRYQSVLLKPSDEQINLLSNIVDIEFREEINTLGEAIAQLLEGSGYRLLSEKLAESNRIHLFAMPLPEVQRQVGPLSLRQALELLGGPAHRLVIEPIYRMVSFDLIGLASDTHDCS